MTELTRETTDKCRLRAGIQALQHQAQANNYRITALILEWAAKSLDREDGITSGDAEKILSYVQARRH